MPEMRFLNAKSGSHPFRWTPPATLPPIFFLTIDMVPPEMYQGAPFGGGSAHPGYLDHLPNLRGLLQDSVRFTNAFSVSPLCGPSRAAYLTGRYPYLTVNEERAHDGHAYELRTEDAIFPEYLKAIGYHTRHVGKGHVGTELFLRAFGENDAAWNRWAPPIHDDDAYLAYLRARDIQPLRFRRELRGLAPDRRTPGNRYGGWVEQADGAPFPLEGDYSHYLAHRAIETLRNAISTRAPLYLQLDWFAPHQPFMIPAGFEQRAAEIRQIVQLPQSYEAAQAREFRTADDEPRIYDVYRRNWGLYEPDTVHEYIVCNLLQMEVLDAALGAFLDEVKRQGLYDDALIVFCGDHGEMNGERALIDKGVYGHPKVARAPLAVKWPGGAEAGTTVSSLASLLDIAPTVLEMVGIEPLARLDGQSLATRPAPRSLLFETHWHVAPNPAVALLWEPLPGQRWMYTYNLTSDVDELYDLADARYRNVAADAACAPVRQAMIRELGRVLSSDPRWRCYWHPFRLDHFADLPAEDADMQMFAPQPPPVRNR